MKWSTLLVFISLACTYVTEAAFLDSLRMEFQEGKPFVFHQVEAKETLFSLSRRYHTSVDAIQKSNDLKNNGLALGAVLRIPFGKPVIHQVSAGETLFGIANQYQVAISDIRKWNNLQDDQVPEGFSLHLGQQKIAAENRQITAYAKQTTDYHIVAPKETLYSIARQHNLSVDDLQAINNLKDFNVGIGDTLLLSRNSKTVVEDDQPEAEVPAEQVMANNDSSTSSAPEVVKPKTSTSARAIKEKGIAAVFPDNDTKKYLALHRSAPVGTIMQVRNEMTNLTVFVRVVGRLPNTGDNANVLLKLSQAAQQGLGALDNRFRVEISYIPAR